MPAAAICHAMSLFMSWVVVSGQLMSAKLLICLRKIQLHAAGYMKNSNAETPMHLMPGRLGPQALAQEHILNSNLKLILPKFYVSNLKAPFKA